MRVELIIIICYFLVMLLIGKVINNRVKTSSDYLAGGRIMPMWLITSTLLMTLWIVVPSLSV
ncbi:hypothetical protein [Wukongibacter sp. M2B1]|uniref:hypothetical protein n=1 Tax=Wukongibacter sp. M2B1 TaxID=3088895 RepID=UPI003D79DB58